MDFPAYVPAAVRAYITALIEGRQGWAGWAASITSADQQLANIEREIQASIRRGEVEYLDSLRRRQKADIIELRDMSRNVECLKRLAHDSRMRDAFALLTREFSDDEQWRDFIHAAWTARMDYAPYRERLKSAAELKEEIADAADKLAKLIRQFSETGVDEPGEFYSIPDLLRKTDSRKTHGRNLYMWRSMRPHVLGDPPGRGVPESEPAQGGGDQSIAPEIVTRYLESREKPDVDPVEEARETLRYGWRAAPCLSELLDTVAKAARDFKPSTSGMIGAAIESRQRSAKMEYLRAFGNLLTEADNFALTTPIMQAMAFVANVVLNLPDVDVTYDNVRHALAKLGGEALENSELVKKSTALGISRSGGARNPHVFQYTLRLLVSSLRLAPAGLARRFAPGATVLCSGGTRLPFARDDFFTTSQGKNNGRVFQTGGKLGAEKSSEFLCILMVGKRGCAYRPAMAFTEPSRNAPIT